MNKTVLLKTRTIQVKSIVRSGETISSYHYTCRIGGKGANQAVAIARAGGIAHFFGTIGSDGIWLKETIAKLGLRNGGIIVSDVGRFPTV